MVREKIKLTIEKLSDGIRYRKMFKGSTWTSQKIKEDSRRNRQDAWFTFTEWRKQQNPVASPAPEPEDRLRALIANGLNSLHEYEKRVGSPSTAKLYKEMLKVLPSATEEYLEFLAFQMFEERGADTDAKNRIVKHLQATEGVSLTAEEYSVDFMKFHEQRMQIKEISPGRVGFIDCTLKHVLDFLGKTFRMQDLNGQVVRELYTFLIEKISKGMNRTMAYDVQNTFQLFVESYCEEHDPALLPANLRSRKYAISRNNAVEANPITIKEAKILLENVSEKTKLYFLLALNCGFYQGDISDLQAKEIDWETGRIIRHRSKNKKKLKQQKTQVMMNFLLWDETFDLLKKHGNRDGLVFLNSKGLPIVRTKWVNGRVSRADNIRSEWDNRLIPKLKKAKLLPQDFKKSFKDFRKTGAELLDKSEAHGPSHADYLQHSLAKRHYVTGKPNPSFDAAIRWLGEQLGFKTER